MKTSIKLLGVFVVLLTIASTNYTVFLHPKEKKIFDFALRNIEALAQSGEGDPIYAQSCYMDNQIMSDGSSAATYSICNSSTVAGKLYPCASEKRGKPEPATSTNLQCYER